MYGIRVHLNITIRFPDVSHMDWRTAIVQHIVHSQVIRCPKACVSRPPFQATEEQGAGWLLEQSGNASHGRCLENLDGNPKTTRHPSPRRAS